MEANRNKKILVVSSAFYPHVFGGGEIAAYNKVKMLVDVGYDVSVATLLEKDDPPAWGERVPEGFRLYRIKAPRQYTLFERTRKKRSAAEKIVWHLQDYFDLRNHRLIGSVLDHANPDHVEIDNLVGIGFNALQEIASRDLSVSYILHDLDLACFNTGMIRSGKTCKQQCVSCKGVASLRQSGFGKVRRLGFISPSRSILERAKKFVPVINKSMSCVIRNVPEDISIRLPARTRSDRIRLLFVGRLHPFKGIEMLLHTLGGLSEQYDFHLTILGTGPSEPKLREEYEHKDWVTFGGFVPRSEVARTMVQNDLLCMTSLAEPYGLVTAQALQLGTPVIGADAGGTAELVRDGVTGMLVPPGDERAWREAFINIFSNPGQLETWHQNAVRHAGDFDRKAIGQAYVDFLSKITSQTALRA